MTTGETGTAGGTSGTLMTTVPYSGVTGVSTAFGTFGELLQGTLPERDGDFLVTLPVARWSQVTFCGDAGTTELRVVPRVKTKALRLTRMILRSAGMAIGGTLRVVSDLPEGKGMASSSADLVATARAVANACDLEMPPTRIEAFLRRMEPTDGVLYPGVVAYHHRSVRLRAYLGSLPPLAIVALDEGGSVDTVAFNRIPKPFTAAQRATYADLLDRMATAVARGDLATIGAVSTRSAELNQELQPKRTLDAMVDICARHRGAGVATAHSGTMVGVLLDPSDPAYSDKIISIAAECRELAGNASLFHTLTFDDARPPEHGPGGAGQRSLTPWDARRPRADDVA
ncbi:hypothetical protein [Actinomadura sp. 9N215]|uniref:GHMP family kinase ATP-binding protein n=1 Tax=Actinomadura sp. 9N215 TaxID=3375150 RepID=UPI0037A8B4DB